MSEHSPPAPLHGHVVVVDDDPALVELLTEALEEASYRVTSFTNPLSALQFALTHELDVLLTDVRMKELSGVELCRRLHEARPHLPILVLTAFGTLELAVEALRAGAFDFLSKPIDLTLLEWSVGRAAEHSSLNKDLSRLQTEASSLEPPLITSGTPEERLIRETLWGEGEQMSKLRERLLKASRVDAPVCLMGETGTGKEVAARALHQASARSSEPFIAINCAAIPELLLESELFGHTKGAFTDAHAPRQGLFLKAGEGTLFLDELGELPLSLQPKLLRVLQEGVVRPVGADSTQPVRCRVISATNVDLKRAVDEGRFRSDLYYRVAVIRVNLPPLRDHPQDILALAQRFIMRAAQRMNRPTPRLSPAVARALKLYTWPGNIRELENCVEQAVAMSEREELSLEELPEELTSLISAELFASPPSAHLLTLEELEREHIKRALEVSSGNKSAAAQLLGIDRSTLYRKLSEL